MILDDLINKIRKHKLFRDSVLVFVTESNLGFEAIYHAKHIAQRQIPNACVMREDTDDRPGLRMDHEIKGVMSINLSEMVNDNKVFFWENFITTGASTAPIMIDDILAQMKNFSRHIIPSKNKYDPPKVIFHGKETYDDHVICTMINFSMYKRFMKAPKYKEWR